MYIQSRVHTASRVCSLYLASQVQVTSLQADLAAQQQELLTAKCQLAALQRDMQYIKSAERLLNKAGRLILQHRARLRQATAAATRTLHTADLSGRLDGRSNRGMKACTAPAAIMAASQACPAASQSAGNCCWDVAVLQPRRAQSVPQQAVAPHQTVQCEHHDYGVAGEDDFSHDDDYIAAQRPKPRRRRTFYATAATAAPDDGHMAGEDDFSHDDDYIAAQRPKPRRRRTFYATAATAAPDDGHDNHDGTIIIINNKPTQQVHALLQPATACAVHDHQHFWR
eukprot:jgi/Chrzof1/5995/Cz17g00020.t1